MKRFSFVLQAEVSGLSLSAGRWFRWETSSACYRIRKIPQLFRNTKTTNSVSESNKEQCTMCHKGQIIWLLRRGRLEDCQCRNCLSKLINKANKYFFLVEKRYGIELIADDIELSYHA